MTASSSQAFVRCPPFYGQHAAQCNRNCIMSSPISRNSPKCHRLNRIITLEH